MQHKDIEDLLERYNNGFATPEEKALVETWYLKYKPDTPGASHEQLEEDQKESLEMLLYQIDNKHKGVWWPRILAAASVILCLGIGAYLLKPHNPAEQIVAQNKNSKQDLAPGGNKAVLTLAGGRQIVLTGAKNGSLARQGNTTINKAADGQINYSANGPAEGLTNAYNTMITPNGGQYQLTLADGTKVWLNAASSIKYPVAFNGSERRVEITGEVYFEVAPNRKKPFKVTSAGQTVEVLGTHFNINAYNNEDDVKTTLLEGSIKVTAAGQSNMIRPGEQARFKNSDFHIVKADANEAVAWKNGLFSFKDANIAAVMRQLARWYDVDVKYEGKIPEREFSGEISRNINASQIIDILSFKKINFKIEGKTIIVIP